MPVATIDIYPEMSTSPNSLSGWEASSDQLFWLQIISIQGDQDGYEVLSGLPGLRGEPGPQVTSYKYGRLLFLCSQCCKYLMLSCAIFFQGPPGIAGHPVSMPEKLYGLNKLFLYVHDTVN